MVKQGLFEILIPISLVIFKKILGYFISVFLTAQNCKGIQQLKKYYNSQKDMGNSKGDFYIGLCFKYILDNYSFCFSLRFFSSFFFILLNSMKF